MKNSVFAFAPMRTPAPGWINGLSRKDNAEQQIPARRDPDGRKLREAAEREKATIVCMDTEAFERIAGNPESLEPVPASWRIVMTGACIHQAEKPLGQEGLSEAVNRWKRHLPQISVNGLGYEGKFSYEGRWF
mgnify:CR=1 FL=1